jgi:hypothetical protein
VRFEVDLDLAAGTVRCNCSFCRKARFWMAFVPASALRLTEGEQLMTDYRHVPPGKAEPFLHLTFCRRCGVRPFSSGGALPQFDGPFYAVNVACLDDASDEELAKSTIHFADGRADDWNKSAPESSYL